LLLRLLLRLLRRLLLVIEVEVGVVKVLVVATSEWRGVIRHHH